MIIIELCISVWVLKIRLRNKADFFPGMHVRVIFNFFIDLKKIQKLTCPQLHVCT